MTPAILVTNNQNQRNIQRQQIQMREEKMATEDNQKDLTMKEKVAIMKTKVKVID